MYMPCADSRELLLHRNAGKSHQQSPLPQFTQVTRHSRVRPPKLVLHRLVHCCKPHRHKEGHLRLYTALNICKLLEVHHHILLGPYILSPSITTPLTTRIHARALKVPATGSSTRYASRVDTTTRILSAGIKHGLCIFFRELCVYLSIDSYTLASYIIFFHVLICPTAVVVLSMLGLSITNVP